MKTPIWRQQNPDGTITVVYSDGSFSKINMMSGQVVAQDDAPNPARAAAFAAGDTSEMRRVQDAASGEDTRRWDADAARRSRELDLRKRDIDQNYRVALMGARTQQEQQRATAKYQEQQIALQREQLAWDREYGQAQLGMRGVETLAGLKGPANHFEAAAYGRGFSSMPGSAGFLSAMQNNTRLAGFGAQSGAPQGETGATLLAKLTGGGGAQAANGAPAQGTADAGYLSQIHAIAAAGGHKMGAGQWESLNPTERKLFLSGLATTDQHGAAFDPDIFLSQMDRSRIKNQYSSGAVRAA